MAASILIVDDDKELRAIYRTALETHNYTVYEAINGAEALKFLVTQTPDVIVMDMLMPMLGGEAMLQRIHQMPSLHNTRLIVLTAYPRFQQSAEYQEVDRFMVKPIKPSDLIESIEELLDGA